MSRERFKKVELVAGTLAVAYLAACAYILVVVVRPLL